MANKILEGTQEGFESLTQTLDSTAKTYLSLEKIIPDVIDLFSQQASDVRMLNKELGSGSRLTADFRKEIIDISKSIGIASRDTLRLFEATKEYHQGITDSTEATLKFQKASGVSMGIIGKFAAKVNILGNISAKTHDKMYENILAVRDAYGLTDEQIGDVVVSLTNYAVATQASDEQVLKASVSLSKFTSLLTSAGIEADRVATILDNMLDPDRMMDNVVLMNRMGITVNDMVSGDPTTKLEEGVVKLKELGQEIANIAKNNRLQASEIAKVYNLTLQEAIQLSELDTSEKALNTQKKLDEYRNETASLIDSLGAFKESVIGYAASLINPLLKGFEKLEGKMGLMSKGLIGVGTLLVSKWVLGKFRDGILSLFGEAARKFSNEMANYLGKVDSRMGAKSAEMTGLTPKRGGRSVGNYGWGINYGVKAENKRNEYNKSSGKLNKIADLGELLTYNQQRIEKFDEIIKKINSSTNDKERKALIGRYGSVNDLSEKRNKLIEFRDYNTIGISEDDKSKYTSAKPERKLDAAKNLVNNFLKNNELNIGPDVKDRNLYKLADVLSVSGNTADALNGIKEILRTAGESEDSIKSVDASIIKLNDEAKILGVSIDQAVDNMKDADKVFGKSKETFGNRFKAFGQGLLTNIGTVLYKVRDTLRPTNLLKGLGKGLKFGALGLLGGVGVKFMASLSKNEKFQESMTTISEKISTIFDGLVAAVEPIIEPVANAIMGIFNWLQPAIDWLSKIIGKIAGLFGGALNKSVSSISKNVSTISDSYKQEDLKTMVAATALNYDIGSDSLAVQMGDVVNLITGISKKIDEGNLLAITNGQSK